MTASSMAHNTGKHPTAREERKLRKPLIERKRRERINNCLDQLKETVIGAFRLNQSKLEKADILEMTVKHLQNIQSSQPNDSPSGLEAQQKYSTGYIQCMHEVRNMLLTCDWMDKNLGSRLLNHLLKSLPRSTDELPLSQPTPTHAVRPRACSGDDLGSVFTEENLLHRDRSGRSRARHQERAALRGSHLGMLEMWRPW